MGVCSTLNVSREAALLALAEFEYRGFADGEIEDRLNEFIHDGRGDRLREIRITSSPRSEDEEELRRAST